MSEFEKELKYLKTKFSKVITPDDLNEAKRLKQFFVDKYVVLVSSTDKTFIKLIEELNSIEREKTRQITSAYLFNKK
jgi:hypothetical protein